MIIVHRETKSRLSVEVESRADPESATVAFAFAERGQRPASWVNGSWFGEGELGGDGIWRREALTPRIGVDVSLTPGHYRLFGKLTNGLDEDVWEVDNEGLEVQ